MFDERSFIARVEAADPEELIELLTRPSLQEEKALRAHLGEERYQRMHSLALKRKVSRGATDQPKGNVVVIHGIMGAELSVSSGGSGDLTWVNAFRIMRGWLDRLKLSDDGRFEANSKFSVRASGIMKRYYGEMLLSLAQNWNVKAFWFDWRKDLDLAADALNSQIGSWFDSNSPVHIVAHSMGGLVARTFIKKYPARWKTMWDQAGKGAKGGRLVMLGTPNYGSFAIPQVATGLEGLVRKLALLDLRHNVHELLETLNTFVGSYQMLPSPDVMPNIENLYNAGTYSKFNVSVPQQHLNRAKAHHQWLKDVVDIERMVYVAGYDQPTFSDIADWNSLDKTKGYSMTLDGDGRVTHSLGLMKNAHGDVDTYYIKEEHGNLSTNSTVLGALDLILETGRTSELPKKMPADRAAKPSQETLRARYDLAQVADEASIGISLGRMNARSVAFTTRANGEVVSEVESNSGSRTVSPEERKVEEAITRGFLASISPDDRRTTETTANARLIEAAEIEIGLVYGGIESVAYESIRTTKNKPVDAIAVGHYIGVQPQLAELAIDKSISAALAKGKKSITPVDLILTQYTERGIIHGRLGQPFLMPDPRATKSRGKGKTSRLIAIAGMNEPGNFGMPELSVLSRELCWALGRLNRVHLATVVIGSGEGNLNLRDAVAGWLEGIRRAVAGSKLDVGRRLQRVTFVEYDPRKVLQLNRVLISQAAELAKAGFTIRYKPLTSAEQRRLKDLAYRKAEDELRRELADDLSVVQSEADAIPSRVTVNLDLEKQTYRFGAITETASIPEREIVVDPQLVWTANNELVGEQSAALQVERGRLLEGLLMPSDLRSKLYTPAPLVMMLDSTMARIHWEMIAPPAGFGQPNGNMNPANQGFEFEKDFLGTSRGFTRQLRTTFAPPPEPPPPPQRILRVLVVADPAEDGHLPGAEEEAVAVADLFESYNSIYGNQSTTKVQVKRLFGPIEATRTNVLRELTQRHYDVLHFAGHCVYEWDGNPNLSGWIFNVRKREVLSANELNRIDRIPKFVFSNACESGITPDRAQDRDARLAPSFAEAFFGRGVANFVCTAWPVDDVAARVFAQTLYSRLLGIKEDGSGPNAMLTKADAVPMHRAMKDARLAIASTPNGRTTWGAYQHYGNPYFRLFYQQTSNQSSPEKKKKGADGKRKSPGRIRNSKRKNARRS